MLFIYEIFRFRIFAKNHFYIFSKICIRKYRLITDLFVNLYRVKIKTKYCTQKNKRNIFIFLES